MTSHTVYRTFNTEKRREFVRITEDVAEAVRDAGITEGMALVCAMHITAAVWINDDEPGLQADVLEWLDKERLMNAEADTKHLTDFKVADLGLHEFGRNEIRLAERPDLLVVDASAGGLPGPYQPTGCRAI